MSTVFTAPGPFARMMAIHFTGRSFRLRIIRDDGLEFTPQQREQIRIRLYTETRQLVFTGFSGAVISGAGAAILYYEEAIPGVVKTFRYHSGYYVIVLDSSILRSVLGRTNEHLNCFLATDGDNTLETFFPRIYTDIGHQQLLAPGIWNVTIPVWSVTSVDSYPNLVTTVRTTTVRSSVPYTGNYRIRDGNAVGRFLFPRLGVVWTPNANLSGWVGQFQVENVCNHGAIVIPWQYPSIVPPTVPPTDMEQRIPILYSNVILQVALGPCPDDWQGTAIAVSSGFGYGDVIPFSDVLAPAFRANYSLGTQTSVYIKTFVRQYEFQWDRHSFQYDTGEGGQRCSGLIATLVQSPALDFEQFTVVPLPETTE